VQLNTNQKSVSRLSRYRNALYRFKSYGVAWVYSEQIASSLGITAAQVRKDFSHFGVKGKRKIGYHVDQIIDLLSAILGKNEQNKAIIAGFGPLGRALYNEYLKKDPGMKIVAAFDDLHGKTQAGCTGEIPDLAILPYSKIIPFVMENRIEFGIIAIGDASAQQVLDLMVLAGIKGVMSLSPVELKSPKKCFVNTIDLLREFEKVVFFGNGTVIRKRSAHRGL
jgi:redox-sensing transcriptional repressor